MIRGFKFTVRFGLLSFDIESLLKSSDKLSLLLKEHIHLPTNTSFKLGSTKTTDRTY